MCYILSVQMTEQERTTFEELELRKQRRDPEEACDSCDGTGGGNQVCPDCLGQGVLLLQEEYDLILKVAWIDDDSVLDAEIIG